MAKNEHSEDIRLKYHYRQLIMKGKVKLSHRGAVRLVGPDCAYHLYSTIKPGAGEDKKEEEGRG